MMCINQQKRSFYVKSVLQLPNTEQRNYYSTTATGTAASHKHKAGGRASTPVGSQSGGPNSPVGCVFVSKCSFNISSACGVNDVRRLRFLSGSLPTKSDRFCMPLRERSSASAIHRSSTGFIFCALFGVMSSFSNLHAHAQRIRVHTVLD